jgi:imidazolonepropionase-like amidohydrolase
MSATREAARVNGIEGKTGTLEAGKEADIILVDGNPIEDLGSLSSVKMTLLRGNRLP